MNNHIPYTIDRQPSIPYNLSFLFHLLSIFFDRQPLSILYHLPSIFFDRQPLRPSSSEQTSKYNFARAMGNRNASKRAANFSSLSLGDKFDLIIYKCRVRCKQTFHIGFILNGRTGRMLCYLRLPLCLPFLLTYGNPGL